MTTYRPNSKVTADAANPVWTVPVPTPPAISLRDWFAGMAMQGEIANPNGLGIRENIAASAYRIADAMLKARGEPTP